MTTRELELQTFNFLVYGQDSKKIGSVGWQNKKYYLILRIGIFLIIFWIAKTDEKPAIYNLL